jgi:trigger factor
VDIQYNTKEDLTATISVTLNPEDFTPTWEQELKKRQKTETVKGFRPGKAPMGMIKKFYGEPLLYSAIYDSAEKAFTNYLKENNIEIILRPLDKTLADNMDFSNANTTFNLEFEVALKPEMNINFESVDTYNRYIVIANDSDVDKEVEHVRKVHGETVETDTIAEDNLLHLTVSELDNDGKIIEEGIYNKEIFIDLKDFKDNNEAKELIGKKTNDTFQINLHALYTNDFEAIAQKLGIEPQAAEDTLPHFSATLTKIQTHVPAEINEALFAKVFPSEEGIDEAKFRSLLKERIELFFKSHSEQLLESELYNFMEDNNPITISKSFLKDLILAQSKEEKEISEEALEREMKFLKSTMLFDEIFENEKMEISQDDMMQEAFNYSFDLFQKYGLGSANNDMIYNYAKEQLNNKEFASQIQTTVIRKKVIDFAKTKITIVETEVTPEAFSNIVNAHNQAAQAAS